MLLVLEAPLRPGPFRKAGMASRGFKLLAAVAPAIVPFVGAILKCCYFACGWSLGGDLIAVVIVAIFGILSAAVYVRVQSYNCFLFIKQYLFFLFLYKSKRLN